MIRILQSVSNMDRAGIETMLMNYYRYMDKSKVQFDFLCNKKKPGAYDDEIKSMGGRIYHTPGLNPAKYPVYLKYMRELFQEHPEYKIVEAHNGALGVYALHAAKVSKIPVRIFHAHGASITKDWKLPIKLVCKACLPTNMTHHFSCGVEAAKCYFGQKVVDENDYVLIPNAIDVARFIYNPKIRNKIRKENNLENKHVVGHGKNVIWRNKTMLFLVFFIVVALLVALKGNKKFILFFMAFYPVLPDYFAIELGGGLPLLKASRILLLILMLCVCFHNKKIHLIRQPLKVTGLYWPLFIYFAARILANGYYALSLSAAINTEFTVIVEQLLLIVMICQVVRSREDVHLCVKTIVNASGVVAIISIINVLIGSNLFYNLNTVSRNVLMVSTVRMGIIRAEATFGHPVYYAMYCALIIPLALYVWQNEKNAWNSCVLGLNVIAAFLTESRGTIVVLLALFLVYVIIADKKTRNRILTAVCAIACVAVVVSFVVPTVAQQFSNIIKSVMIAFGDSSETIENFGGNSSTGLESRMIQLSGITWMLMHNAIFGLGASCHTRGKLSYYINDAWSVRDTIDNGYVAYFVEEGLLGGLACFSLFFSLLRTSWKRATFKNAENLNNGFFLCFLSYVAVMLSVADISQLLWVIIALYIIYNSELKA